jgi:deoxyribodipyrimidine photo-lyase
MDLASDVPALRCQFLNSQPVEPRGDYVLYWMTAFRRPDYNFALQRAVEWARQLKRPLVVLEALRSDYRWASDRLHAFVLRGMIDNARYFEERDVAYYPYVEPAAGAGRGLLARLAERACVVVGDDFPCFFLPRMLQAAARSMPVRMESIDGNGLLPMRAAPKVYTRAFSFRSFLQKNLAGHLLDAPLQDPTEARLPTLDRWPAGLEKQWPRFDTTVRDITADELRSLPIDHGVPISPIVGGRAAAQQRIDEFFRRRLDDYSEGRNHPDQDASSGFSPYLHFGHMSVHQVFERLTEREKWTPGKLAEKSRGSREGWWGMSPTAESFLDELVTWREIGFNMCWQDENYDQYASLPDWAQATLRKHEKDPRDHIYSLEQFEQAETHDVIWNAAQRQLRREGRMHNYLRMLWGKKILEWTACPRDALEILIELNNKWALDGRNPNSYSGIFWTLGRYDRAWGPERPVFGTIRFMSSDNTARKVRLKEYLKRFGPAPPQKKLAGF